ncbi:MAG: type I methionyl aminopeptidase [Thermoleophilia bacterium]|nr:type I methionyl aminopeptidase [Thermoleophilia bacterium]
MIIRKSRQEIEGMARAGRVVAGTLALLRDHTEPGAVLRDLDTLAEDYIRSHGGTPTSLGYKGYPAAICISPNELIVHGIPGAYALRDGDIVTYDIGVTLDGLIADSAWTFPVGDVSEQALRLLATGERALYAGIAQARAGNRVGYISAAVQDAVEGAGFAVVKALVGHGVGRHYHEDPQVPNYGPPASGRVLAPGMTLAIEPMITAGSSEIVLHEDEWSISTADGSLSGHFEHTVAITEGEARILTRQPVETAVSASARTGAAT